MTSETYYKATRPDGRDFYSGTIDYGAALVSGEVIRHPSKRKVQDNAATYLSVSVSPSDCTGASWPCRLFRVEPIGRVGTASGLPNKRTTRALRVVEELPAWQSFGPNGERVVAFIDACGKLTKEDWRKVAPAWYAARDAARGAARGAAWYAARDAARGAARDAARGAARGAARDAARGAAWDAARDAARGAAWDAARDAAWAILTRDLITSEQYDILTQPFVDAGLGHVVDR